MTSVHSRRQLGALDEDTASSPYRIRTVISPRSVLRTRDPTATSRILSLSRPPLELQVQLLDPRVLPGNQGKWSANARDPRLACTFHTRTIQSAVRLQRAHGDGIRTFSRLGKLSTYRTPPSPSATAHRTRTSTGALNLSRNLLRDPSRRSCKPRPLHDSCPICDADIGAHPQAPLLRHPSTGSLLHPAETRKPPTLSESPATGRIPGIPLDATCTTTTAVSTRQGSTCRDTQANTHTRARAHIHTHAFPDSHLDTLLTAPRPAPLANTHRARTARSRPSFPCPTLVPVHPRGRGPHSRWAPIPSSRRTPPRV
ncbi:hypothetical protein C8R45DRAFT_1220693 [Mycena sanguinolenta]|nr:hypothetical protein C8R45DRAFT_1220693 [Mycena sanguinolenta]